MRDDARDVSIVTLNIRADLLGSSESGAEEHESVSWTRDVVGIFVARVVARKWYGHARESSGGRKC